MADVFHRWGSDLTLDPAGDLAIASGTLVGQQRVLRRLLTSPGDYIWQLDYGAGLGGFVGSPAGPLQIRAVVRSQIFKESVVARNPEPSVEVNLLPAGGGAYVNLRYADSLSGQVQPVSFAIGK